MAKKHIDYIAEWLKDVNTAGGAKKILESKTTPFGDKFFRFDKEVDDVLRLAGSGDNKAFKELITKLGGEEFINNPDNDIFYTNHGEWYDGRLDDDKLVEYRKKFNKQYMSNFNILTVYERGHQGRSSGAFPVYVIDFNARMIYLLEYEEFDDGDEQYLSFYEDDAVKF